MFQSRLGAHEEAAVPPTSVPLLLNVSFHSFQRIHQLSYRFITAFQPTKQWHGRQTPNSK